jgi:N-hydroxyarylamine O-acetyltransferase
VNELVADYASRIGCHAPFQPTLGCLRYLHEAHLYNVPFENFSMHHNAERGLTEDVLREAIVDRRRGGICFETGRLMQHLLDACGFAYDIHLASGAGTHRTPATHQIFVVSVDTQRWLFDIGYGARGPRGLIPLVDGAETAHPALSSRITLDRRPGAHVWTVSIKEHAVSATDWQEIYSFADSPVEAIDLDMAHFYTTRSPKSLLNRHKVASIPTPTGRVSVRDGHLTIVADGESSTSAIDDAAKLLQALERHFGLTVPRADLGLQLDR